MMVGRFNDLAVGFRALPHLTRMVFRWSNWGRFDLFWRAFIWCDNLKGLAVPPVGGKSKHCDSIDLRQCCSPPYPSRHLLPPSPPIQSVDNSVSLDQFRTNLLPLSRPVDSRMLINRNNTTPPPSLWEPSLLFPRLQPNAAWTLPGSVRTTGPSDQYNSSGRWGFMTWREKLRLGWDSDPAGSVLLGCSSPW